MAITNKSFYFMRHGETDWNRRHIYMGQTDIQLNNFGIQKARQAAKLLEGIDFASIASSPLMRATHTAQIITEKVLKPITIIDDLKECSWGIMEGLTKMDNQQKGGFEKQVYNAYVEIDSDNKVIDYYLAHPEKYPRQT